MNLKSLTLRGFKSSSGWTAGVIGAGKAH